MARRMCNHLIVTVTFFFLLSSRISANFIRGKDLYDHNGLAQAALPEFTTSIAIQHQGVRTRRALQEDLLEGRLGNGVRQEIIDGWHVFYDPLEALFPSGNAAADLLRFYDRLIVFLQERIAAQGPVLNEIQMGDPSGNCRIHVQSNVPFDWSVIGTFLGWIVSKSPILANLESAIWTHIFVLNRGRKQIVGGRIDIL